MFGLFKEKTFRAEPYIEQLGCKVHDAYKQGGFDNKNADKEKIILVIECFFDLYKKKSGDTHDGYYIGNLISSGKTEGKVEDIIGTVEQAVNRTIEFIRKSEKVHSSQCEYFSRNLKVILEKEDFLEPPQDILNKSINELNKISQGHVD